VDFAKKHNVGIDFNPTFFSHDKVKDGLTLTSPDEETRKFWIEHGKACIRISEYFAKETGVPCVMNVWIGDGYKDIPADRMGPRMRYKDSICIIELDEKGENYRIVWGLVNGGRPTSELPSHLMNHEVKMIATGGKHRVIYHAHTTNIIALTFVLPLEDKVFTRELWEMATECPVVFPEGVGVVPWMVPGGRDIAVATSELMKKYNLAIWAHHGMFASGEDFDLTFGLMHTAEKSAEILVKMLSMQPNKRQTITPDDFRHLAKDFNVTLPEEFLYEK
jgi:rhamnulose-1-phosphate aldolase